MSGALALVHLPFFSLIYAVTAVLTGLWWSFRVETRVLLALSGVMLGVAGLNVYVESWGDLKHLPFEKVSLVLLASVLLPYSVLCVILLKNAAGVSASYAFAYSFLPFAYLLTIGFFASLNEFLTFENPPLVLFSFVVLTVAIHAPCFAFAKSQIQKQRGQHDMLSTYTGLRSQLATQALISLLSPLLLAVTIEVGFQGDWRLLSLDSGMTVALVTIFLAAKNRRWNILKAEQLPNLREPP